MHIVKAKVFTALSQCFDFYRVVVLSETEVVQRIVIGDEHCTYKSHSHRKNGDT